MTKHETPPRSCSLFETPRCVPQFLLLLASSHHHPTMKFYYFFLLLLVVFRTYSESSHLDEPPDPFAVTHFQNSSSTLGRLAPVLPQNEVLVSAQAPSGVLKSVQALSGVLKSVLPQSEVLVSVQALNGMFKSVLPQNEVIPAYVKCFKSKFLVEVLNIISKLNSVLIQSMKIFKKNDFVSGA